MPDEIKRYIQNAQISHVSYVDKAANKKKFFLTKADDRRAVEPSFEKMFKPLIKADDPKQLVYGVVYEPDVADTHNEAMTANEIEKAAHGFMKDARNIDKQHDFGTGMGEVVESYVAPETFNYGGETIQKGSWVLVTKATDEIWEGIQKGEITGYSMAGVGEKVEVQKADDPEEKELTGFMKAMKNFFTKGEVKDQFNSTKLRRDFRAAENIFNDIMWQEFFDNKKPDAARISAAARDMADLFDELAKSTDVVKAMGGVEAVQGYLLNKEYKAFTSANTDESGDIKKEEELHMNEELKKNLSEVVKEATKDLAERVDKLEKSVEEEETNTEDVQKSQEETTEELKKNLSEVVKEALKPLENRLDKVEKARGFKKSAEQDEVEEFEKSEEDVWEGLL